MTQSTFMSFAEAAVSNLFGIALSVLVQMVVFSVYDIEVSLIDNLSIVLIFTVVSIIRTFIFRRLFNWLGEKPLNYIRRKLKWNI